MPSQANEKSHTRSLSVKFMLTFNLAGHIRTCPPRVRSLKCQQLRRDCGAGIDAELLTEQKLGKRFAAAQPFSSAATGSHFHIRISAKSIYATIREVFFSFSTISAIPAKRTTTDLVIRSSLLIQQPGHLFNFG